MSSRKQRNRLWAERRIAHDIAVENARNERSAKKKAAENKEFGTARKAAKSTKKTPRKETK